MSLESTGTKEVCNNCNSIWSWQDDRCPECGSTNTEDWHDTLCECDECKAGIRVRVENLDKALPETCNNCDQGPCGGQKVLILPDPLSPGDAWIAEDPIRKKMNGEIFSVSQQIIQEGRKFSYISSPKFYDNAPITVVPSDWLKDVEYIPSSELGVTNQALLNFQGLKNRVEEMELLMKEFVDWYEDIEIISLGTLESFVRASAIKFKQHLKK